MIARKRNLLLHGFVILSTVLVGAASRPQNYLRSLSATCNTQTNSNPNSCWARNNGGSDSCMYCSNEALCLDLNTTRVEQDPSCTTSEPCRHQTANGVGFCRAFFGYKWDGDKCAPVEGCSCQGPDCDSLPLYLSECEAAHQSCMETPEPTPAPSPEPTPEPTPEVVDPCTHQDAIAVGPCRQIFGYRWDGQQCSLVGGCRCLGPDCGSLHPSSSACQIAVQSCIATSGPTPAPDPDIIGLSVPGPGH